MEEDNAVDSLFEECQKSLDGGSPFELSHDDINIYGNVSLLVNQESNSFVFAVEGVVYEVSGLASGQLMIKFSLDFQRSLQMTFTYE